MILFCLHARLYNWTKQQATQPEQKQSIWEQLQQAKAAVKPTTRYGKAYPAVRDGCCRHLP
jgi:hypothetical protein